MWEDFPKHLPEAEKQSGKETIFPWYVSLEGKMSKLEDVGLGLYYDLGISSTDVPSFLNSIESYLHTIWKEAVDILWYASFRSGYVTIHTSSPEAGGQVIVFEYDIYQANTLNASRAVLTDIQEAESERIELYSHKKQTLAAVFWVAETIFKKNGDSELDIGDNVDINTSEFPWSEFPGLGNKTKVSLRSLRVMILKIFREFYKFYPDLIIWDKEVSVFEETYLDYIVGIGDRYEGWARFFHSDEEKQEIVGQSEIEQLTAIVIAKKSIPEIFDYMLKRHAAIESNNFQSDEVKRTYALWNKTLNSHVLSKMKVSDATDLQFLQYAQIVSGRNVPSLSRVIWMQRNLTGGDMDEIRSYHSLDGDLESPESASEALLYVFEKPGGIFHKIQDHLKIKDPKISSLAEWKRRPSSIIHSCIERIESRVEWKEWEWKALLQSAGFTRSFLELDPDTTYEQLSTENKMRVSILVRLKNKIGSGRRWWRSWQIRQWWKIDLKRFWDLFLEAAEEWQDIVIASINDSFDGEFLGFWSKDSRDVWLSWTDAQLFDLYNTIHGNGGLLDLSDVSQSWARAWLRIWAVIIWSIALTVALWWIAAPLAFLTATNGAFITTASLAGVGLSRVVMQEGYDTNREMAIDLISDAIVAVMFGRVWWAITRWTHSGFIAGWGKWMSDSGVKHLWANAWDLLILWIGTELLRNYYFRSQKNAWDTYFWDLTIEAQNRFSYEDFHNYVRLNLSKYLPDPWLK